MAPIKKINLENGATAAYHNIIVYKDSQARAAKYQLYSYTPKGMRSSDKTPVLISAIDDLSSEQYTGHREKDAYRYLKILDIFTNATESKDSCFSLPAPVNQD